MTIIVRKGDAMNRAATAHISVSNAPPQRVMWHIGLAVTRIGVWLMGVRNPRYCHSAFDFCAEGRDGLCSRFCG
jgi:hypothetical protein